MIDESKTVQTVGVMSIARLCIRDPDTGDVLLNIRDNASKTRKDSDDEQH